MVGEWPKKIGFGIAESLEPKIQVISMGAIIEGCAKKVDAQSRHTRSQSIDSTLRSCLA
jgi:hypothetical protein